MVLDGAKALYKGVREVFGERALIQRCRVHKLRNVLEHLPLAWSHAFAEHLVAEHRDGRLARRQAMLREQFSD
jgi:transposase-like protein